MRFSLLTLFLGSFSLIAQEKYTLSGYLKDEANGEALVGANIYIPVIKQGTAANLYGFFSLTLPKDTYEIVITYVGFQSQAIKLFLDKNTDLNLTLSNTKNLKEVEISAEKTDKIHDKTQMSTINIPMEQIDRLPTFMGERDLVKIVQLLPGVKSSEGSSGMYVRGGGPDQNLILLDGVPVYNVNHLFGFFSVFNSDAIGSVELTKAGFPSRYGGRISSVLDIRMKEGNSKKLTGTASIGLISSRLTLEGPIIKDKTSFIVSARRTYLDVLTRPLIKYFSKQQGQEVSAGYYFYDVNAKINHTFSPKNRLFLSIYTGSDKASANINSSYSYSGTKTTDISKNKLVWGNLTSALRWNYLINKKLFSNTTLTYSKYRFLVGLGLKSTYEQTGFPTSSQEFSFDYTSGIYDVSAKIDFDYLPNPNHFIKFGISNIYHTFTPGVSAFKSTQQEGSFNQDTTVKFGAESIYSHELGAYIEDDIKIGDKLKVNVGIHLSSFLVQGQTYFNPQPRLATNYLVTKNTSLKASYSIMNQYIHLLTNGTVGLPTDLWVPVTDKIKPMTGKQFALGVAHTIAQGYELTVEGYYKTMDNIIEYKDGVSFLLEAGDWQNKVESGKGWAYGSEVFLQKKTGKTAGWIGYTLSWTNRQFENLNFGKVFPYKYDRRHDISVAITHTFSEKFNMGMVWVYGTGNAITLPIATYSIAPTLGYNNYSPSLQYYEARNSFRTPAYHRMDISFNFVKKKKWGERTWNLSVYNAYNRQNPFYLYFGNKPNGDKVLNQISLFPFIPAFSYIAKF